VNGSAPDAATTLFCIPHAGGNAAFYAGLGDQLPATVACRRLELPGRGRRHAEPLGSGLEDLARDLLARMRPLPARYALFGHSMGALLAFLCAVQARESGLPQPRALFLSSAAAPVDWEECRPRAIAALPSRELWDHVAGMGGLPDCVAASSELLQYLEPILRADFAAVETWNPAPVAPLPSPITLFMGDHDVVTEEQGRRWRLLTAGKFRIRTFAGGHFYLRDHWPELAANIARTLRPAG
jgi:surfactin synthase thioesterase subunit